MKKLLIILGVLGLGYFFIARPSAMPQAQLPIFDGKIQASDSEDVGGYCANQTCLTIYVAPWCPACRRSHDMILSMVAALRDEGVKVQVVLGLDQNKALYSYGQTFPFPVLLDVNETFYNQLGRPNVPFFVVSNKQGKQTQEMSGAYRQVTPMREALEI